MKWILVAADVVALALGGCSDPGERLNTPGEKIDGWKVSHLSLRHS